MKTFSFVLRCFPALLLVNAAVPHSASGSALDLFYDSQLNPGWFGTNAWGESPPTYDSSWTGGSNATVNLDGNLTLNLNSSTTVGNLTVGGSAGTILFTGSGGARALTFDGGTISLPSGFHDVGDGFSFQGDFIWERGNIFSNSSVDILPYSGTATIKGGNMDYNQPSHYLGANSNFVLDGGNLIIRQQNTTVGSIQMDSGGLLLGRTNAANSFTLSLSSLSGSGGDVIPRFWTSNPGNLSLVTLNLNQAADTSFGANIMGVNEGAHLLLNKSGAGDLTLTGDIEFARKTTVSNGGLFINSTEAVFGDDFSTTAIEVTGGILGGTGTIEITGGDNVVLGANGQLAAGMLGVAGRTTFALGNGTLDLSLATASASTGWLRFDLGGNAIAGVDYDQILLSSGALDIGSGLSFNDFDFNLLAGFSPGDYILFDTSEAIIGSLGSATGTLGGYDAELLFVGDNLVLQVIPEPATWFLLGLAAFGLVLMRRRSLARHCA